ncbi:RibD family protein [Candidatus Daviesbacteria bacterium]|nr:RibD family protein [Candidatus Daviesbacteria bacterium]
MLYPNLKFPKRTDRPFFYTNFVSTVDGKVQVLENTMDYWPIGSKTDYKVMLELRAYADCLIHGKNLAKEFGEITLNSLNKNSFKKMRQKLGKDPILPYFILSGKPETLEKSLGAKLIHLPGGNLQELVKLLQEKKYKHILVEGGPTLLGSFLKENLIDEIFLTIAPKIFGSTRGITLTLVEGYLFPKNATKNLSLLSIKKLSSEIYLRYKVRK